MLHAIENAGKEFGHSGNWHLAVFDHARSKVVVILEPECEPKPPEILVEQAATYSFFTIPEMKGLHPLKQVKWFRIRKNSSCSGMEQITFKELGQVEVGGIPNQFLGFRVKPVSKFSPEEELFWEGVRDKVLETGLAH